MEVKDLTMAIKMGSKSFPGIRDLSEGRPIDEKQIEGLCQFVDCRFDCSDFRIVILLKTLYEYSAHLSEAIRNKIKTTLLGFHGARAAGHISGRWKPSQTRNLSKPAWVCLIGMVWKKMFS